MTLPFNTHSLPTEAAELELNRVLSEPLSQACASQPEVLAARAQLLRERLAQRVAASLRAETPMHTVRRRQAAGKQLAPGVVAQILYEAQAQVVQPTGAPAQPDARYALRPGEPLRTCLLELAPNVSFSDVPLFEGSSEPLRSCEWLVLSGRICVNGEWLAERDYHRTTTAHPHHTVTAAAEGGLVFVREAISTASADALPVTVRDLHAGWPDFAPGIQRRVLWQHNGQAALLYRAQPGAQVPSHRHGHDEECLLLQGELFLDDLLLQPGDYQLAPAGSGHHTTETDTGAVIYAHGDVAMDLL